MKRLFLISIFLFISLYGFCQNEEEQERKLIDMQFGQNLAVSLVGGITTGITVAIVGFFLLRKGKVKDYIMTERARIQMKIVEEIIKLLDKLWGYYVKNHVHIDVILSGGDRQGFGNDFNKGNEARSNIINKVGMDTAYIDNDLIEKIIKVYNLYDKGIDQKNHRINSQPINDEEKRQMLDDIQPDWEEFDDEFKKIKKTLVKKYLGG